MTILVNGEEGNRIDARDRGLQFGDGVFETLRLHGGVPQLWSRHWERLCLGLDRLGIPRVPERACLDDLSRVAAAPLSLAKLIVTRGVGPRGYAVPARVHPTRIVIGGDALSGEHDRPWLHIGVCGTRTGHNPLPGCKHLNRIENILARMEWGPDWDEGVMLDRNDHVVSGTQGNLLLLEGRTLVAPTVQEFGIAGTRRAWVMERAARAGLQVHEARVGLRRARDADAVFLSNSRIGLRPARWVGDHATLADPADGSESMALMLEIGHELNEMA
ncbi:Aminodeoxychorismate lyase [Thioalkalivibrio nitratireducens DSM 14787]|uniref:Aminodeoxychorismate lyase n=1 Tax=Thioalkalivibrio nitratireducens (strain DSM 14787 / UNIQEM 213 / ALEN2) TaxID=1255043 RepID=L0DXY8_THIND|nr:aminotransferase class IV [Thioalkalivibrio nitratireducens]AGA33251.1 Aminodeoxychorismate lyase [Thioalkalivibrio nitratireducens DSM 14787]